MVNGFLRLPRSLFSSPASKASRSFSTFEAYQDLLQSAAWRPKQFFHKGQYIPLEPGDLMCTSLRLAQRWNWSPDEVKQWVRTLAEANVLAYAVIDGLLKISLDAHCNDKFLNANLSSAPPTSDAPATKAAPEASPVPTPQDHSVAPVMDIVKSLAHHDAGAGDDATKLPAVSDEPTSFPEGFPMDEFRTYLEQSLKLPVAQRPRIRRGWIAEMRDQFLKEKEKAKAKPQPKPKAKPKAKRAARKKRPKAASSISAV